MMTVRVKRQGRNRVKQNVSRVTDVKTNYKLNMKLMIVNYAEKK